MRIPRRARSCRVRRSLHPCALLAVRHGVALKPPTPQARMVRARGARREGAGHSYGPWLSPTPTKISRRARHRGKHLLRAPHGAPGRVHQTPPAPLGARLSARREPRGLRTTARPVAPTRARGALVSVSLARLGHEKVSSNVRSCPGTPHRGGHVLNVPASRVPASGGEHVPLVLASGGSGKLVTFVLHHPRARDARERKIEFFRILPAVSVVLYRGSYRPLSKRRAKFSISQFLKKVSAE